jgi:hypothetical protein
MISQTLGLTDMVSGPASKASGSLRAFAKSLDNALGIASQGRNALGQFTESIGPLTGVVDAIAPFAPALLAVAGAAVVAAGALVGLIFKGSELALEVTEMRDELRTTFEALGNGPGAGAKTLAMLDQLGLKLPQTTKQLGEWATTLMSAGMRDAPALEKGLKAIASAQAIIGSQGDAAAKKVTTLLSKLSEAAQLHKPFQLTEKQLQGIGVDVADIAKQLGIPAAKLRAMMKSGAVDAKKFGDALQEALIEKGAGPLEKMGNRLSVVWGKFKENIGLLFADVDTGPFIAGLKDVLSIFGQNTASGKAMKAAITGAFNAIFSVAAKVFPYVKAALLQVVIAGLKIYIALKPAAKALSELFKSGKDGQGLATFMRILIPMFDLIVGGAKVASRGIVAFVGVVKMIEGAFDSAKAKVTAVMAEIKSIVGGGGSAAGGSLIDGLVAGVESKSGMIMAAIRNLGGSIIDSLKGALGVHSPSTEMMKIGNFAGQGLALGMKASNDNVGGAAASMSGATMGGAAAGAKGGPSSGGGIHIDSITININGAGNAHELTEQAAALIFERIALEQGLGTAA